MDVMVDVVEDVVVVPMEEAVHGGRSHRGPGNGGRGHGGRSHGGEDLKNVMVNVKK